MQFLPETVELYMSWGTSDRLEHITMTTRPTLRFTLKPYTCRFPSGTFTPQELADIYTSQSGSRLYGEDVWRHLYVAKGIRATYTMYFVLNEAPMEELPLIGQPLPSAGTVAARVAAIEGKPKNEVVTPVKESIVKPAPVAPVKKHRYFTRSKGGYYDHDESDSEDEWDEDSDGRPIRMPKHCIATCPCPCPPPECDAPELDEDSEVDEGVERTYPSKMERLLYFPDGLELYVQDVGSPKWDGIHLDIQAIPPFRWGPKAGEDRGKQVRFKTPKHPEGINEHHLVAHYRKHILKEHVSSSSNGLQCIFVASGRHKDQSLASLLLDHSKKELELTGSSIQPVQLDVPTVMARLEAADVLGRVDKVITRLEAKEPLSKSSKLINEACLSLDDKDQEALKKAFEFEAKYPYNWAFHDLPPPLSADVADEDYDEAPKAESEDEDMYKDMPPLISIAELTLERLKAKEAALEAERQTLNRIEGKLADIRALEQEVGPRRRLWCAEEFGSDCKESNLDKVEADYKAELLEIERLEERLATVRALGYEVATRREALLKAAESM